jgi:hypothetical protein
MVIEFISLLLTMATLAPFSYLVVNDDSRVMRMTLQVVASPTIIILTTPEVSFMLVENIYSTGFTSDNCHRTVTINS